MALKTSIRMSDNLSAKKYNEYEKMVSIQLTDDDIKLTDFIFHENYSLKFIKSELTKDELKMLFIKLIDQYYDQYK